MNTDKLFRDIQETHTVIELIEKALLVLEIPEDISDQDVIFLSVMFTQFCDYEKELEVRLDSLKEQLTKLLEARLPS